MRVIYLDCEHSIFVLNCIIARGDQICKHTKNNTEEKKRKREERDNRDTMGFDSFWFDLTGG